MVLFILIFQEIYWLILIVNLIKLQKHKKNLPQLMINDLINILEIINKSNKPVIIAGGGVKIHYVMKSFKTFNIS